MCIKAGLRKYYKAQCSGTSWMYCKRSLMVLRIFAPSNLNVGKPDLTPCRSLGLFVLPFAALRRIGLERCIPSSYLGTGRLLIESGFQPWRKMFQVEVAGRKLKITSPACLDNLYDAGSRLEFV